MASLGNVLLLTVLSWFAAPAPQAEDAVARFSARISHGEAFLEYDDTFGYLPSVLRELSIRRAIREIARNTIPDFPGT